MNKSAFLFAAFLFAACTMPTGNIPTPSPSSSSSATSSSSLPASVNTTGMPLNVPPGFAIEIMAKDLPGARVMVQDRFGNFWVSQTSKGTITQLEMSGSTVVRQNAVFRNLQRPHGLAISNDGMTLYIAEENRISRVPLYSDGGLETLYTLPHTGRHFTRTLGIGPDDRLYISIGSTCDVCVESDPRNGSILSMKFDGTDVQSVATGLRNSVFFTWSFVDGRMWATEMGRDGLGDDLPPDEINVITEGKNYGWPYCYGKQIRDMRFEPNTNYDCSLTEPSTIDLPAHVAPLDLAFVPEEGWPESLWYDLIVAEHGAMQGSTRVGYVLKRIPLDAHGNPEGEPSDFLSGWWQNGSAVGRPVGILIRPGGMMYITDDKAGVVYRINTLVEAQ